MLASGNSDVQVCVQNLLTIEKGTVPYARNKGIDSDIIDEPVNEALVDYKIDADRNIEMYETRIRMEDISQEIYELGEKVIIGIDVGEKEGE